MADLIPIIGAWVCKLERPEQIGRVEAQHVSDETTTLDIDFGPIAGRQRLRPDELGCGLQVGHWVQDEPLSGVRDTFGSGTVLQVRELSARYQALVQFHATGECLWLPFERLCRIMDPALLFRRAGPIAESGAERLALNVIAHALTKWNEATGALDRLDIDPLPHQISLVHRIINSGQTNWLIADDVGLGKTIEVGLLLAALERQQNIRRILLVVPSSLTQQWKEEMLLKFDRQFRIFGTDFRVADPGEWGLYEKVIVSLDLAKPRDADDDGASFDTSFGKLLAAGNWDIVIFDEAHRLSRDERGRSTLRFKLAQALRSRTDAMILLSGTPHQGDQGKFLSLLKLVRGDLSNVIDLVDSEPAIVQQVVLRNRKIDAVDLEGNFLFKGLLVRRVEIATDADFLVLEAKLKDYLRRGYSAGENLGGTAGRAIGFVMTIYRKLASSSVEALRAALQRRHSRIVFSFSGGAAEFNGDEDEVDDSLAERGGGPSATPFFDGEAEVLKELISHATKCKFSDKKGAELIDLIRALVVKEGKKVLIFTEYRATQDYLVTRVQAVTGKRPEMIHGGQTVDDKRAAVAAFEAENPVLISTEAGGEGLNLHRECYVLINYDLPWNPARISQRIGRLYRYGQKHQVIVINFHARDTIDNEIVSILMERLSVIVRQMGGVGAEFGDLYASEVMGELLDRIDISELLDEASTGQVNRTQDRIDEALNKARQAKELQDDILSHAAKTGVEGFADLGYYSTRDLAIFIQRAAPLLGILVERGADDEQFTLRLPDDLKGSFPEFGARTVISATTLRNGTPRRRAQLLDFSTAFLQWVIRKVTSTGFNGGYAALYSEHDGPKFFAAYLARFQNDQGRTQSEKFMVVERQADGTLNLSNSLVSQLLSAKAIDVQPVDMTTEDRKSLLETTYDHAELVMASEVTKFKHPNDLVLIAVAERLPSKPNPISLTPDTPQP